MLKTPFPCRDCGSDVVESRRDGRYYEHRGVVVLLPVSFAIPQCTGCKTDWFSDELIKNLELVLEQEYLKDEGLIKSIIELYKNRH